MKSSMINSTRKRPPLIAFSLSISLIMAVLTGCSDKGHCAMHQFDNDLVQIYTTIDAMPAMVKDRKTNKIWNTALTFTRLFNLLQTKVYVVNVLAGLRIRFLALLLTPAVKIFSIRKS